MTITVSPYTEHFVAEVGDVDLSRPLPAEDAAEIRAAFAHYAVLVFPGQSLDEEQHLAFTALFGPHEKSIAVHRQDMVLRHRPEIADISNLNVENEIWGADSRQRMFQLGNRLWHTDSSFRQLPGYASALYARTIAPIGGHTQFADMRAAWDALPADEQARLAPLVAEHSIFHSRARLGFTNFDEEERASLPPVLQRLARVIPESGRSSLYIASHVGRIVGMDDSQARELVDRLMAFATQPQFVHTHRWRVGDLVIWDNRCTMHRGTDFDDLRWTRDMRRSTVSDVANTCEQDIAVPVPGKAPAASA
ncbi:MAG: TauD/TfdA family dioxygenase [Pseudomonadota bacterium]|nr:TauD/TfdA family dioxygenase [Pseudomonadota bacterium]